MVYGFVCQSGGHVTLYSELGLGTSFGLYFPALPHSTVQSGTDAPNGRASVLPQGNGETILIVEDNPKVRKLSGERIRDLGFQALEAESGDQAYQMLKAGAQVDQLWVQRVPLCAPT
jgi:hypothetical protein